MASRVAQHLDTLCNGYENAHSNGVREPAFILALVSPLAHGIMPEVTVERTVLNSRAVSVSPSLSGLGGAPGPRPVKDGNKAKQHVQDSADDVQDTVCMKGAMVSESFIPLSAGSSGTYMTARQTFQFVDISPHICLGD